MSNIGDRPGSETADLSLDQATSEPSRREHDAGEESQGDQVVGHSGRSDEVANAYGRTVEAARRTYERAGVAARTAVQRGEANIVERAEARPVTMVLAALAIGFVFGRAV
jgi:hypothetical protein